MKHKLVLGYLLGVCSLLFSSLANSGQWHLQLDNDIIFGDDGNYTNGMILSWESTPNRSAIELPPPLKWQSNFTFHQDDAELAWGLKLIQQMWTPGEIEIETPQSTDRPYAGYLALESHTAHYGSQWAQKNWFSLGVVGPASGAQQVQEFVHKITGSSPPLGWHQQVENQVTLQLAYEVDGLLIRGDLVNPVTSGDSQWELSGFSHSQVGNFRTETNLGLTFRWGNDLENSFGRLSHHSGHMGSVASVSQASSIIFYSRASIGYRLNDLTLDGSLPYDSQPQLEKMQAGLVAGILWSHPTWSVGWSFNTYSREYQTNEAKWHGYGSLLFSWHL